MAGNKTTYYYKLYRVKRKHGKVTTVSLDPALVMKACQVLGGPLLVGKLVREAAFAFEETEQQRCCSHFVQQTVKTEIAKRMHQAAQPVAA